MSNHVKTAIVYDWIDKWGGVERILLIVRRLFPHADFFSSYVDLEKAPWAKDIPIKTSFIQKLPAVIRSNRVLSLPFYPYCFEALNLNEYRLVFSISSSFAKSVITKPGVVHISYILTPLRYVWLYPDFYANSRIKRIVTSSYMAYLKKWDFVAAQRPDHLISISQTVASRCLTYYHRHSDVLYPPFDEEYWNRADIHAKASRIIPNYFLVVSRLEPYKSVDLVIRAFNKLKGHTLLIIGEGSQERRLKKISGGNIHFLKRVTDQELIGYYRHARALIMPQEEDFGYVALEAQFFGCPVIAFRKGGATETVMEGKTGIFFDRQDEVSLRNAIERYHTISYNLSANIKIHGAKSVARFGKAMFEDNLMKFISSKLTT